MTPKEKAVELVGKYALINYDLDDIESHKECALIAVNFAIEIDDINLDYLYEVKEQIQKL